jgi:hypothetical protein
VAASVVAVPACGYEYSPAQDLETVASVSSGAVRASRRVPTERVPLEGHLMTWPRQVEAGNQATGAIRHRVLQHGSDHALCDQLTHESGLGQRTWTVVVTPQVGHGPRRRSARCGKSS